MKKKLLLGTTFLIAAGVVSGNVAQAAEEPITAGIGGYFRSAMALISQDDADGEQANNDHSHALGNDIEITVSGSTTLDNGITAGFSANIEGNGASTSASSALDERNVFFRGSFGQIRIGQTESARQEMTNFAPSGNYNFGVNSPFFAFGATQGPFFNVRTYSDGLGIEDNLKLVYFSPTIGGFRVGASYAPDDSEFGQYGANAANGTTTLQNNASVAAEFSKAFDSVNFRVMIGWEGYVLENCAAVVNTQNCNDHPESTQFGGSIGFGEWSIGGGFLESDQVTDNAAGSGTSREDWDLGVAWWHGSFGVGLQYGQAELDIAADSTTDELTLYELNATYVLGPGIDVGAAITKFDYDDASVGGLDNQGTEVKMSAALSF